MTQIITPEERLAEDRGVHALIVGPYGIGKTTLLRTLDPSSTLFVNTEDGDLAVHNVPVPHVRPRTWQDLRDLVVGIAGPNPSFGPNEPYSQAHFDRVGGFLPNIEKCRTVFFDTLTAAGRLCFRWASAQPEASSERTGKPGSALGIRTSRQRIPAGAAPPAKRSRAQHHPDRRAGNRYRRLRSYRTPTPDGRPTRRARDSRHCRSCHHDELDRLRRR